jgi:CheY-like chemotaxis protein
VKIGGVRGALVRVDETRLCQVFLNLLQNAAHALAGHEDGRVDIDVSRDAEDVVVRVRDNGPGVPEELAGRLFEPWVTGRANGTGLGLALCRQYLVEMGGTIELHRTSPGTTFEVTVPSGRPASAPPTLVPDGSGARTTVLVVDDNPLVVRALQRVLGSAHAVEVATNSAQALRRIGERWFDLVFVDLHLANENGRELYERMAAMSKPQAKQVVFVSGGFEEPDLAFLEKHGIAWIRKPFGAQELRTLVAERTGRG